jgi:hypothetical protein
LPEDGPQERRPRIPKPEDGIQVNFCRNPRCDNFGVPASTEAQPRGRGASTRPGRDSYNITHGHGHARESVPKIRAASILE